MRTKKTVAMRTPWKHRAYERIGAVRKKGATFDDFQGTDGFMHLDPQVHRACEKVLPKGHGIRVEIAQMEAEWRKDNKHIMVTGRQMLLMICELYTFEYSTTKISAFSKYKNLWDVSSEVKALRIQRTS